MVQEVYQGIHLTVLFSLREKCGNTEVFSGAYSVRMRENTEQKKFRIWTLFTQCLDIWVFDNTIFFDDLFTLTLQRLVTCLLINNRLCGKLVLSAPVMPDDNLRNTSSAKNRVISSVSLSVCLSVCLSPSLPLSLSLSLSLPLSLSPSLSLSESVSYVICLCLLRQSQLCYHSVWLLLYYIRLYVMLYAIWYHLYKIKKTWKTAMEACYF